MTKLVSIIFCILLPIAATANDFKLGRSTGLSGAVLLSNPTVTEKLICPVSKFINNRFSIETGYNRQYNLADLDEIYIAANYSFNEFSVDIGFSQFGERDYYIEQMLKFSATYRYKYFALSILAGDKLLIITTENDVYSLSAVSIGLAGGMHYKNYHAAIVVNNLNKPKVVETTEPEEIKTDIYAEIESLKYFSIVGRVRFEKEQQNIYSIGQNFTIKNNFNLFWGVQANPVKYSGGFKFNRHDISLIYALSHHPVLGFSHNISISYFTGGKE